MPSQIQTDEHSRHFFNKRAAEAQDLKYTLLESYVCP